jgi:hypothetical protein
LYIAIREKEQEYAAIRCKLSMVITTTGAKENQSTKELLCWNAEIHIGVFMCRVKVPGWAIPQIRGLGVRD